MQCCISAPCAGHVYSSHSDPTTASHTEARIHLYKPPTMPRCSLKRLVLSILTVTALGWTVFLFYNHAFAMRQKSILRYQIERELGKYVGCLVIDEWMYVGAPALGKINE